MKHKYETIEGKVRYVLEHDELARTSDNHLVLTLWRTFYSGWMITNQPPGVEAFNTLSLLYLPSKSQILAARRRISPKVKWPVFQSWHERCP